MHEYRNIIYRLQQGQSIRSIERDGIAGFRKIKAVKEKAIEKGWLNTTASLPEENELVSIFSKVSHAGQTGQVSPVNKFESLIEKWMDEGIQASTIYNHLVIEHGYTAAYNSVQRFIKKRKDVRSSNVTVPLHFKPGEAAQVDFGKGPNLLDERTGCIEATWFFVMTLCWSRHQYVELVTHQDVETWLNCHQNAFNWFGGVIYKIIIDNPKCAIIKANYHEPQLQRSYEAFAEAYGFIISACPPREPQKKGRVESGVKYVKKNFLPLRSFVSLQDANRQVKEWILSSAGNRVHGSTFEKPLTRFTEIEKFLLKQLPAAEPELTTWHKVVVYRNCHVPHQKCFYSVPYTLYRQEIWLKQTATTVTLYHNHNVVAQHPRLFKEGTYSTLLEHLPHKAQSYLKATPEWCLEQSKVLGPSVEKVVHHMLNDTARDLLRSAQGVIRLGHTYGSKRLEKACQRLLHFNVISYHTLKEILANGLDYEALEEEKVFDELGAVYQGQGTFQRIVTKSIH